MPWVTISFDGPKQHRKFDFAPMPGTFIELDRDGEWINLRVDKLIHDQDGDTPDMRCMVICTRVLE
jgi:hypothetical protein